MHEGTFWLTERLFSFYSSADLLCVCVCVCTFELVYLSDCLLSSAVMKPHLLAAHQDQVSLNQARFLLPFSLSARQPDSHRSPAQMPWPTLHVCRPVCVNKCVRARLLLALSRTASQLVTTLPHISESSAS